MNRPMRILVAEEDRDFIELIKTSLLHAGDQYQVETVFSGADSLQKLTRDKFDILLLDHSLPDGKGLEWLRRFNQMGIGIPTVFVTATPLSRMRRERLSVHHGSARTLPR